MTNGRSSPRIPALQLCYSPTSCFSMTSLFYASLMVGKYKQGMAILPKILRN